MLYRCFSLLLPARILRFCLLCAFAGLLVAQSTETGVLIQGAAGGRAKTPREAEAVEQLSGRLADFIQELIPCSKPSTMQDVRDALSEARDKELLGSDNTADVAKALEKVNVRDVVTVDATEMGGQIVLTVFYMDMKTAKTVLRNTEPVSGDETSIDSFAEKFAANMKAQPRFANLGACPADKEWYGSIRGSSNKLTDKTTEKNSCTEIVKGKDAWRYTVRIPRRGKPAAFVSYINANAQQQTCKRQIVCGLKPAEEVSNTSRVVEIMGAANVPARVSAGESGGKLYVEVSMEFLPVLQQVSGSTHFEGPCQDDKPPKDFTVPPMKLQIPVAAIPFPAQAIKPGQKLVQGSAKVKDSSLSWRLTRAPAGQRAN